MKQVMALRSGMASLRGCVGSTTAAPTYIAGASATTSRGLEQVNSMQAQYSTVPGTISLKPTFPKVPQFVQLQQEWPVIAARLPQSWSGPVAGRLHAGWLVLTTCPLNRYGTWLNSTRRSNWSGSTCDTGDAVQCMTKQTQLPYQYQHWLDVWRIVWTDVTL